MNDFDYWKIGKWVLIVLLAGFIGQFGKSLAKYFMAKGKELRQESASNKAEQSVVEISDDGPPETPPAIPGNQSSPDLTGETAKAQKKALKALTKQKKKKAKRLTKEGE